MRNTDAELQCGNVHSGNAGLIFKRNAELDAESGIGRLKTENSADCENAERGCGMEKRKMRNKTDNQSFENISCNVIQNAEFRILNSEFRVYMRNRNAELSCRCKK